ncbi:MAG: DUF5615 family PIN-like protein, partial [bacterium]
MAESTGDAMVNELRRLNHDVVSIHEQAPGTADSNVLNIAALKDRLLLTND